MPRTSPAAEHEVFTAALPHAMEANVRRKLLSEVGLNFSSLVVRRIPNGVCLEGVLEVGDRDIDVTSMARLVAGVEEVQNHLLVRQNASAKRSNRLPDSPQIRNPR